MATSNAGWDNKFSTTLSSGITASDTTIPLTALPTASEGWLVIEPDSSTAWEEIYYTSKTGSAVVCPSVLLGRGQGGSTPASHNTGSTVRCDTTAEMFEALQDGTALANGAITSAKAATGFVVQIQSTNYNAVATGTTILPSDDTIPQNTEGDQYMTQAITPKSATNRLLIDITIMLAGSIGPADLSIALFQDSTANAIAARAFTYDTATRMLTLSLSHDMLAGTTSATTFKLRAGLNSAGTTTFNGQSGGRRFGGITVSNIKIMEYKA